MGVAGSDPGRRPKIKIEFAAGGPLPAAQSHKKTHKFSDDPPISGSKIESRELELAPSYGSDRPPLFPKQRVARAIAEDYCRRCKQVQPQTSASSCAASSPGGRARGPKTGRNEPPIPISVSLGKAEGRILIRHQD